MATQKKFVVKNGLIASDLSYPTSDGTANQPLVTDGAGNLSFGTLSTSTVTEGSNLYYTDARADARVALIVDAAPSTLDTLNELAAALGDDANFSTTVTNSIANKLPLAGGTMTGDVLYNDNVKAKFGTNIDLEIYHDGSNSYIHETGVGNLNIKTNVFRVYNSGGTEIMANFIQNGAAELYHDAIKKFATSATGIDVTGNVSLADGGRATFGTGDDLQIYHTGGTSVINDTGTGRLFIGGSPGVDIGTPEIDEYYIRAYNDGAVELYYDNAKKLETTSTGLDVTGNASFANNGKAIFGASNNLQIFSTGTSSYVAESGSGDLYIKGSSIYLTDTDNNQYIHLSDTGTGGTVVLKHNAVTKLATTATGIDVTGTVRADDLTIGHTSNFSNALANDIQVGAVTGSHGISILSQNNSYSSLFFADNDNNDAGSIRYNHSNNTIDVYTDRAQRVAINSTGIGVTGDVAATNVNATTVNATTVDLGDWTITEASGSLLFATQGVTKMKLDSSGNLDVVGNVNSSAYIYSAAALIVNGKTPPLAFDFVNSYFRNSGNDSTFGNSLTFTRASSATMTSSSGLVVTVASGVNRLGHHIYNSTSSSWVNSGILIESEARTNYVQDSHLQDTNNGMGTFITTRGVFTENNYASPDGTANAAKFAGDGSNNSHKANIYVQGSGTSPGLTDTATFSVYLKQGTHRYAQVEVMDNAADVNGGLNRFFINIDLQTGTIVGTLEVGSPTNTNGRIENVGNGWYRASATLTKKGDNVRTDGGVQFSNAGTPNINPATNSGANDYFYIWGAQLEAGRIASSLIPTAGGVITRAAELLTVAAAKMPSVATAPFTEVSGTEILTNSGFDTDTDWTKGTGYSIANGVATKAVGTASGSFYQEGTFTATPGKMYKVELDVTVGQSSSGAIIVQMWGGGGGDTDATHTGVYGTGYVNTGSTGTYTWYILPTINRSKVGLISTGGWDGTITSFSLKEVEPPAWSIQMQGRMTYNDFASTEAIFFRWLDTPTNYIQSILATNGWYTGRVVLEQRASGDVYSAVGTAGGPFHPGVNLPFKIASRHGNTFLNGAVDGTALTADTTPTSLPDLSSTNLLLGFQFMGTIGKFVVWNEDIGDTGIASASL